MCGVVLGGRGPSAGRRGGSVLVAVVGLSAVGGRGGCGGSYDTDTVVIIMIQYCKYDLLSHNTQSLHEVSVKVKVKVK